MCVYFRCIPLLLQHECDMLLTAALITCTDSKCCPFFWMEFIVQKCL